MGRRILLADDSHTIRKVVELTFADSDFEVVAVPNGELALQKVRETRPDVVLLDVIMPGKDGYEVCELIKTDPSLGSVPVLLMAGSFEPFDKERAHRAGSDGFLAKPFDSKSLVARVTELLESTKKLKSVQPPAPVSAPPPVAIPEPLTLAVPAPPDATMIFPAFREVRGSDSVGFEDFVMGIAGTTAAPDQELAPPPEASFADLEEDLRDWERKVVAPPRLSAPAMSPQEPLMPTETPRVTPPRSFQEVEEVKVPLWRIEPTPLSIPEAPSEPVVLRGDITTPIAIPDGFLKEVSLGEPPTSGEPEPAVEEIPPEPLPLSDLSSGLEFVSSSIEPSSDTDRTAMFQPPQFLGTDYERTFEETGAGEAATPIEPQAPVEALDEGPLLEPEAEAVEELPAESVQPDLVFGEELIEVQKLDFAAESLQAGDMSFAEELVEAAAPEAQPNDAAPELELGPEVEPQPAEAQAPEEGFPWAEAAAAGVEEPPSPSISEELVSEVAEALPPEPEPVLEPLVEEALPEPESALAPGLEQVAPAPQQEEQAQAVAEEPALEILEEPIEEPIPTPPAIAAAPEPEEAVLAEEVLDVAAEPAPAPRSRPSSMETLPDVFKSEPAGIRIDTLPPDVIETIARRVVAMMSEKMVEQIAWEVVPDLAEILVKKEIERLQKGN